MLSHKEGSKLHDKIADAYRNSIDMMDEHGEYNAALLNDLYLFVSNGHRRRMWLASLINSVSAHPLF